MRRSRAKHTSDVKHSIGKKIIINTVAILLLLSIVLVGVMSYFMTTLTNTILLDTLQPMAKAASQSIENNLHLMSDRIFMIADNPTLASAQTTPAEKQAELDHAKSGIEFNWLALYGADGNLFTGSESSPGSIAGDSLYSSMKETANLVIDDTRVNGDQLEIVIGTPVMQDGNVSYYLVGSYQYDVLNDLLSNINVGKTGVAFIIDENGIYMAHQDAKQVASKRTIFDTFGDNADMQNIFSQMADGQTGSAGTGGFTNHQYFSYSPVRGTHWSFGITAPQSDFMDAANQAIFISILLTIALLLLSIFPTMHIVKRIQKPLRRVTKRLAQLSDGDLHSPVEVEATRDETEVLSRALSQTVLSINSYTSELSRVLNELSKSNLDVSVDGEFRGDFIVMKDSLNKIVKFLNLIMQSIQRSVVQVSETSHMVSTNALHVQESSGGQAGALSDLEHEAQSISQSIDAVDTHTRHVHSLMQQAMEKLGTAQQNMDDMSKAMQAISNSSEEITKINKFLEEISFQTNILALNASVEAARAGEAGKGFSVVATEVRDLAGKSGDSSRKTAQMIQGSQSAVQEGSGFVRAMAESIEEIQKILNQISDITAELEQSVANEKDSLKTITGKIESINQLARHNLSSSGESAQASQSLTDQADALEGMAKRFTLRK